MHNAAAAMKPNLLLSSAVTALFFACTTPETTQPQKAAAPAEAPAPPPALPPPAPPPPKDPLAGADADMKAVLDQLAALGGQPIETLSAEEARKQPTPADAVKALLTQQNKPTDPEPVAKVEERKIKGPGGDLPVRIYWPSKGKAPYPVVLYFHGGGFVIATNDTYDATPRALANGVGAVVISPEYRKAPENKFPAAHDDALAAYTWLLKNAASIKGDAKRIVFAGESAGGNLAAATAIAARDAKMALPKHLLLVYPIASGKTDSPSYQKHADAKPLNKAMMSWFSEKYFRTTADGMDPRINLVGAKLEGLPPTTIINAEIDPLESDGKMLG